MIKNKNIDNKIINEIKNRIQRSVSPDKIILFGSHAQNDALENSDVDLLVVTDDDQYPQNYKDKMDIYLKVAKKINDFQKKIPIDLIVYTRPMFEEFLNVNSQFAKEIMQKGIVLYEKNKSGMA